MRGLDGLLLALGGLLLYFGAEWLVRGAAGIAAKLGVRPLVIGLTVVAYGTSAPELVVGVGAALSGHGEIAFGNAVGSNIANIGLILGVTSCISPPKVDGALRRREVPLMLASALVVPALLLDGHVSRVEGACLVLAAVGYTLVMVRAARAAPVEEMIVEAGEVAREAADAAGLPPSASIRRLAVTAVLGLGLVLLGGKWLVDGASGLALSLGVPPKVVGLTIVSVGTSLPELATSIVAARRGHSEIALGNVVGSNIFNVLLILGASGVARTLDVDLRESATELSALVVMTFAAALLLRRERRVSRSEGSALVALYTLFLVATVTGAR